MSNEIRVTKNEEEQQAIPSVWRQTLEKIVESFAEGDFQLSKGIAGVRRISVDDARRIAGNIESYGAHITILPEAAWDTSACQWMGDHWDVLVDLYTVEEGASDLALSLRVYEVAQGYDFQVESLYVP